LSCNLTQKNIIAQKKNNRIKKNKNYEQLIPNKCEMGNNVVVWREKNIITRRKGFRIKIKRIEN